MGFPFSKMGRRARVQPIGYLLSQGMSGDCISLAAGLVDFDTLPAEEVEEAVSGFFAARGRTPLQYGTTEGLTSLREKVRRRICEADGIDVEGVDLGRVMISSGSQQMLYILTELMVDAGDIVITPAPSYFVYLGVLETAGAEVHGIPIDEEGMRSDLLAERLGAIEREGRLERVKIVYMASYFQNPSGVTVSASRRKELLETIESFGSASPLVIEDAAYRELDFSGGDVKSMWGMDGGGRKVAYLGTFSKPFSPGLRTGFALLPEEIAQKAEIVKGNHDFGSANFSQHMVDYCMESGYYDRHVTKLRETYRRKCELMCRSLRGEFGDAARWRRPGGGLYVWVDVGEVETGMGGEFFKRCLESGVLYVPGEFCYGGMKGAEGAGHGKMRLSFGPTCEEEIGEGVARLARALRSCGARV